jgi:hypothetical protein
MKILLKSFTSTIFTGLKAISFVTLTGSVSFAAYFAHLTKREDKMNLILDYNKTIAYSCSITDDDEEDTQFVKNIQCSDMSYEHGLNEITWTWKRPYYMILKPLSRITNLHLYSTSDWQHTRTPLIGMYKHDEGKVFKSRQYSVEWKDITPLSIPEGCASSPFRKTDEYYSSNLHSSDTCMIEDSDTHQKNPNEKFFFLDKYVIPSYTPSKKESDKELLKLFGFVIGYYIVRDMMNVTGLQL